MSKRYRRSITKDITRMMNMSYPRPSYQILDPDETKQKKEENILPVVSNPGCLETPVHEQGSVVQYCPSQIVFVKDNVCEGRYEYLKNRPLIVMRVHPFTMITSLTCITCGSSSKMHGINLRLNGFSSDTTKITQAHPWAVVGLNMNDISRVAGFVREDDFAAIKDAFNWHMTGVGERPKYLEEHSTVYNAPPEELREHVERRISKFGIIPPLKQTIEETPVVPPPIVIREKEDMKAKNEYSLVYDTKGKLVELSPEVVQTPSLSAKAEAVINSLTDNETAQILGRVIKNDDLIRVYHCSKGTAGIVKSVITEQATTKENVKRIITRTRGSKRNVALLNHVDRVTLSVFIPASVSGFTEEYLMEIQRQEGISEVKNGRAWEGYRAIRSRIASYFNKSV